MNKRKIALITLGASVFLGYAISYFLWSVPHWANTFLYLSNQLAESLAFSIVVAPLMVAEEILSQRFAFASSLREWILVILFVSPSLSLLSLITLGYLAWKKNSTKLFIAANVVFVLFVVFASVLGPIYARSLP